MFYKEVGHSQEGAKELVSLFDGKGYFDGPKPTKLLQRLITLANCFFASIKSSLLYSIVTLHNF